MERGKAICEELKKAGIHYLAWLPDTESHFMHDAIQHDSEIKVIQVCREGEAVGICVGLHLGGKKGALLVENQGMFEFGNILKNVIDLNMPLVMLISYLSFHKMQRTPGGMIRAGRKDYTEPFLDMFGIQHYLIDTDADVTKVGQACKDAEENRKPVALLLTSVDGFLAGT